MKENKTLMSPLSTTTPSQRLIDPDGLMNHLIRVAGDEDSPTARAEFAALRHSLRDFLRAAPYVAGYLGDKMTPHDEWMYTIAALFAYHRDHRQGNSLGKAFRQLKEATGSDAIEQRFISLLSTDRKRLADPLRHAILLLASHKIPLDWRGLRKAIWDWDTLGKTSRRALAHDFYRTDKRDSGNQTDANTGEEHNSK